MPSLKDLRNRIASVKATQKITKAMQMVAAAKLRRAQMAAEAARPYAERMETLIANIANSMAGAGPVGEVSRGTSIGSAYERNSVAAHSLPLLTGTGHDGVHLLVVCTAERGLCGAFNSAIARLARDKAQALIGQGKTVKILCVGKKGYDLLKRQFGDHIIETIELRGIRQLAFENADTIGRKIISLFEHGEFDVCTLFFSRFRTVLTQIPTALQLIPAQIATDTADERSTAVYEYEPDEDEILSALLPRNISVQVFRALLENAASEQGARMTAMDNATRNAGDMIKKQTLKYNRTRQAMITKELIEIISGAEAL